MEFDYKKKNPDANQRRIECEKILRESPEKIPIIFEKDKKCKIASFPKTKYLVSRELTVNHFQMLLREKLKLSPTCAFFLLAKGKFSISGDKTLGEVYEQYKDEEDGLLYMIYSAEQVWG